MKTNILKLFSAGVIAFGITSAGVLAQETEGRTLVAPPMLQAEGARKGGLLAVTPTDRALSDEVVYELDVEYISNKIWNPREQRFDAVKLRGYTGKGVNPDAPYIAPTIEARPGDTVRLTINNNLPEEASCINWARDVNIPHCFNTTNMHSHGLWINPAGNSDNVLVSINPGVSFQYEYNIPPSHPAGTFWYHPHRHGSTALQVGSGMAGALIIRGDRAPTLNGTGDIDVLLKPTPEQPFTERLLVFLQIPYACRDKADNIKGEKDAKGNIVNWTCDEGEVGTLENYDQMTPSSWPNSGRYTSINGSVLPKVTQMKVGDIERWRMVHAGVRDTIRMQFRKRIDGAPSVDDAKLANSGDYIGSHCTGEPVDFHLIAADGLTTANAVRTPDAVLQPGYRWDALVTFDEPGVYCVVDADMPPPGTVSEAPRSRQLMGFVEVTGAAQGNDNVSAYVAGELAKAAEVNLPTDVADKVAAEILDGLSLASFVPHKDLSHLPKEGIGDQTLVFFIDVTSSPTLFMVDGKPYDPTRIDRTLRLGDTEDWTLTSDLASHPFHIHVNPFQVLEILDPYGRDVSSPLFDGKPSVPDNCCGTGKDDIDPQFAGLKGVWKDTLWVKNAGKAEDGKPLVYQIKVRTQYRRYIGDFVLHCHILDHEDQGMMQNVRIALPDGRGGFAASHH